MNLLSSCVANLSWLVKQKESRKNYEDERDVLLLSFTAWFVKGTVKYKYLIRQLTFFFSTSAYFVNGNT